MIISLYRAEQLRSGFEAFSEADLDAGSWVQGPVRCAIAEVSVVYALGLKHGYERSIAALILLNRFY